MTEDEQERVGGTTDGLAWETVRRAVQIVDHAHDLPSLVRPLLDLLEEISGLEATYLTRVDWDDDVQLVELAHNVGDGFRVEEGALVDWGDSLCELSLQEGSGWNTDVPGTWGDRAGGRDLGIVSYVSVPVHAGHQRPYGTLCGASPRKVDEDPTVVPLLRLFALLIGDAIMQDRLRRELGARAERAENLLEQRIRFTASVEHAMRTPLTVIEGWARLLRRRPGMGEDERDEGLASIQAAAERLTGQLGELLAEARTLVTARRHDVVDVAALVEGLRPALDEGRPLEVRGELVLVTDRDAMAVLVEHLVENAVAHTPPGTPVRVLLSGDDEQALVVVEDDGPGLPDRDDLFEAFVSADLDRPGTGLGLHIVRAVAEQLGGTVEAGAADSGGARFTVRLPV